MNRNDIFPIALGSKWGCVAPDDRLDVQTHATIHVVIQVGPGDLVITCAKAPESQPVWGPGSSFMGPLDLFLRSFRPITPVGNAAKHSAIPIPFA